MAKRSRILRTVGCEPLSVLRAHTPDQNLPAPCEAGTEPDKANPGLHEFKSEIHRNETGRPVSAVLTEAVERLCSVTGADGAVIALLDQWGVICRASSGTAPAIGSYLQPYSGLTRECLETGQVVICEDAESDFRVRAAVARSLHLRSAALAPIVSPGSVLGVVEVFSSKPSAFDSIHVAELLRTALLLAPVVAPESQEEKPVQQKVRARLAVAVLVLSVLVLLLTVKDSRRHAAKSSLHAASPGTIATMERAKTSGWNKVTDGSAPSSPGIGEESGHLLITLNSAPVPKRKSSATLPDNIQPILRPRVESRSVEPEVTAEFEASSLLIPSQPTKAPIFPVNPAVPSLIRPNNGPPLDFVLDRTIRGHSGWVTSVAFSVDGQRLASGSWDQSVKIWDVRSGQQLSMVASKMKEVQALAFSRDGRWLAAENSSDSVTLWDGTTGQEIRTLVSNKPLGVLGSNWVYSIAFSPDGRWLASALDDKTIRLWDVKTGRALRDLAALRKSVTYAAFSSDGRWLASGADDKTISISETSSGQEIQRLIGHTKAICAVVFSPDGHWLASAGADKSIKIWNVETGREVRTLTGHKGLVTSLSFSSDGRWLASGSWDKTIKIWDMETGNEVQTLAGHNHSIYTVAFDSRGKWLASGSEDGTIKLWRLDAGAGNSSLQ
jgi:WD40 repeat protein